MLTGPYWLRLVGIFLFYYGKRYLEPETCGLEVPWLFYKRTLFFLQRFNIGFHTKLAAIKNVDAMLSGMILTEFIVYFLELLSEFGAHTLDLGFHVCYFKLHIVHFGA